MATSELVILGILTGFYLVCVFKDSDTAFIGGVLLVVSGLLVHGFGYSEWAERQDRDAEARERAEETPHVVRAFADCKVYAWRDGLGWHESTRCEHGASKTSTTHQECHLQGKMQVCHDVTEHLESD